MQFRRYEDVARLASRALEHGAVHADDHLHVIDWNVGAFCDDPQYVEVVGRSDQKSSKNILRVNPKQITVRMSGLPCRKCEKCSRVRATHWRERAMTEMGRHSRTWFVTFTLNPDWQHRVFMEEIAAKNRAGWLDTDFSEEAEFRLRCDGGFKLMTKFWKNVRKPQRKLDEQPVLPRYLLVAERHLSGLPHYHALVSEAAGNLTYRRMESRWLRYGFFNAKLVTEGKKAARYVTKYIAKSNLSRVRASQRYGSPLTGAALAPLWAALEDDEGSPSLFTHTHTYEEKSHG